MKKLWPLILAVCLPSIGRASFNPPLVASATQNVAGTTSGLQYLTQTTTGSARVDLTTMGGSFLTLNADGGIPTHINGGSIANTAFTANAGTNLNTSLLAVETGGNLAGINTNAGATTDAATTTDVNGTLSAKLRGLVKMINDMWDSVNHRMNVFIQNATLAVTQSGTWTVQPGNTANTTAWKVDGSGVTQPVSGTFWQGTQPVSIASMPSTPVTGTFWQATQPISGTVTTIPSLTQQVNLTQIGTNTIVTAGGNPGELKVSVQIAQDSSTVQGGLGHNVAAATTNRLGALVALVQTTFSNGTALTALRDAALSVGTDGLLWVASHPPMSPPSFSASVSSASYTTTTDLACLPGNGTNTVIVRKITLSCTQTTAGVVTVSLLRRSTADSGGTSAAMKVGKDDSTSAAAVSVPLVYSAAPTKGTLDTMVDSVALGCMATGTASPNDIQIWNFTDKAKVLRGTAQEFCLSLATPQDLAGTTVTGGVFNVHFAWDEITTITP